MISQERGLTDKEFEMVVQLHERFENRIRPLYTSLRRFFNEHRNCVACTNWHADRQRCQLANATPPAEVIVKGCEKFDEIGSF